MKKLIYVCSPYRGDYEQNLENAKKYSRIILDSGMVPVTPHMFFSELINDTDYKDREIGIAAGIELLKQCHQLWVFADNPSEGMQAEIDLADRLVIPVYNGFKRLEKILKECRNATS